MNIDATKLKGILDCMDAEADERDKHSAQIRDIVKKAKGDGFETKALRKVWQRRRMDPETRQHDDDLLDIYEHALGAKGAALRDIEAGAKVGEAAKANGVHRATLARARHVANEPSNATPDHDPITGEITETADGNPSGESSRHDRRPDGPGSALATNSEVAPNEDARAAQSLPLPDADGVSRTGTNADAARLRAQIPFSTDPKRLKREAERAEGITTPLDEDWCELDDPYLPSGRVSRSDEQEAQAARKEDDGKAVPCAGGQLGPDRDLHDEGRLFVLPDNDDRIRSGAGGVSGVEGALGRRSPADRPKESGRAASHEEEPALKEWMDAVAEAQPQRVAAPVLTPDVTTESDPWESAMAAKAARDGAQQDTAAAEYTTPGSKPASVLPCAAPSLDTVAEATPSPNPKLFAENANISDPGPMPPFLRRTVSA